MSSKSEKISTVFEALDGRTSTLLEELAAFDDAQLDFQADPGTWSIRDVAHHLMLVESGVLRAAKSGKLRTAKREPRHWFGKLAVTTVLKLGIRVKVPQNGVVPQGDIPVAELKEKWLRTRSDLKDFIFETPDSELGLPLFRHAVAGPLDCRSGVEFLARHSTLSHLGAIKPQKRSEK